MKLKTPVRYDKARGIINADNRIIAAIEPHPGVAEEMCRKVNEHAGLVAKVAAYEEMLGAAQECDIWIDGECVMKCQDGRWRSHVEGHMDNGIAAYDHPGHDTALEAYASLSAQPVAADSGRDHETDISTPFEPGDNTPILPSWCLDEDDKASDEADAEVKK